MKQQVIKYNINSAQKIAPVEFYFSSIEIDLMDINTVYLATILQNLLLPRWFTPTLRQIFIPQTHPHMY
ncbi:hypothetical protein OFAG_02359 [Oxalobacter formigenes HOxBLS]|uniref:Uncharacterized protein n=1 Tax=Oxalobacter paraformigenes TaxID=556268 RepID=T5LES1_9BURK|nr:hypothetical protein OFAG_02359 [Oxalobacter paraformigenes]